jgi:hypothetical protein
MTLQNKYDLMAAIFSLNRLICYKERRKYQTCRLASSFNWLIKYNYKLFIPSQGHYGFPSFRLLTDFVCLYTYEFWLFPWKISWISVMLLLPLFIYICYKNLFSYEFMTTVLFINKDVSKRDETLYDECIFKCRK